MRLSVPVFRRGGNDSRHGGFTSNAALQATEGGPPHNQNMTDDNRYIPRRRVLKGAKIISTDGSMVVDCVIRNLSVAGAKLDVPATLALPHEFTLLDVQTDRRYIATMAWRRGDQMGVEFSDPPEDEDDER
jgi:hypothetical protein